MVGNRILTCAKCGVTSSKDSSLSFHRFPLPSMHGSLKAKVWAKYCFPYDDWTSDQSLSRLYRQYKTLCGKHFDDSSFTCSGRKRLNKFAIPFEAQNLLVEVREELQDPLFINQETCCVEQSEIVPDVGVSTSQCTISTTVQWIKESNPQTPKMTERPHKGGILREIGVKSVTELTQRELKLYKTCRKYMSEIYRLRRKNKQLKKRN